MKELNIGLNHDYILINLVEPDSGVKHEFKFNYDDNTLNNYKDSVNPVINNLNNVKENATFDEIDDMLKEAFEFLLGPGEYKRIKKVQNSIINRQSLIFEMIKLIEKQLSDLRIEVEEKEAEKYSVD